MPDEVQKKMMLIDLGTYHISQKSRAYGLTLILGNAVCRKPLVQLKEERSQQVLSYDARLKARPERLPSYSVSMSQT